MVRSIVVVSLGLFGILLGSSGCGSTPIHAVFISGEKNAWVEDPGNSGLNYCVSNSEGARVDPVCYPARRAPMSERAPSSTAK
jgi:hypothetical protein